MLFLLLVRGSSANQGAAIFWQLIEMSGLSGEVYTELYRAVHRALSAIRNNGVSAFQGEVYTGRIGSIVETLEIVRIIEVSAFQGYPQGGVPLYTNCQIVNFLPFIQWAQQHDCSGLELPDQLPDISFHIHSFLIHPSYPLNQ